MLMSVMTKWQEDDSRGPGLVVLLPDSKSHITSMLGLS